MSQWLSPFGEQLLDITSHSRFADHADVPPCDGKDGQAQPLKYAILTFGCRANQADSFDLDGDMRACGGEEARVESADVVVVNTCSVTATAEHSARQAIRRVRRLNPAARIVATGCYAVRQPSDLASLGVVVQGRDTHAAATGPIAGPGTRGRTLYLLRVQTGCSERCAYCIVPATRGTSRSMAPGDVRDRIAGAVAAGFKEVVLTGVHLGSYGRDLEPRIGLADLLRSVSACSSGIRFRLSAVEPMDFGEDVVLAVTDATRFARHFHLPLQHASDRILALMSRPYTLDRFRAVVQNLLEACPDAAVGSDLIVGFPGETEADFEACAIYLESAPFAYVHVFPFSARPGTPAAALGGRPRGEAVRRRVDELRKIGARLAVRFRARFVGAIRDGLTIEDGTLVLTDNYLRVRIPPGLVRNERVKVRILTDGEPMTGVVVHVPSQ